MDPIDFVCGPIEDRVTIRQEYFTDRLARELKQTFACACCNSSNIDVDVDVDGSRNNSGDKSSSYNGPFDEHHRCRHENDEDHHRHNHRNPLLFISDIRRDARNETMIMEDMAMQARWHKILNPRHSMLKFRLPWTPGTTRYLNGTIMLPVWGPQTTTETRLIVHGSDDEREYDHMRYMEQMFHFNTVKRVSAQYAHDIESEGFDHCFDSASEIHILRQYIMKYRMEHIVVPLDTQQHCRSDNDDSNNSRSTQPDIDESLLKFEVEMMIESVTQECSMSGRNLLATHVPAMLKQRVH